MEKTLDRQGRWRSKTVAFRVSPEENNQIEMKVRLSGLTKQDYIVSRLSEREIRVVGNPRVYKALKNQMADIYEELQRLTSAQEVTPDMAMAVLCVLFTTTALLALNAAIDRSSKRG